MKTRVKVLSAIHDDPKIMRAQLAGITGMSLKGVDWTIKRLKGEGLLRRSGPDKGGHWEVVERKDPAY